MAATDDRRAMSRPAPKAIDACECVPPDAGALLFAVDLTSFPSPDYEYRYGTRTQRTAGQRISKEDRI
jgi:hypothetical protein